jgi:hypothetical protein
MANNREVIIDAPIPGQSLTAEPKSRPWRRPYRFATVDEAVEFYMPMFSDETFTGLLVEQIENGVPLTTIAEILATSNVMEGNHSIDVAVLVSPVLIEAMQYVADVAGVEATIGTESELYNNVANDSELVRRAVKNISPDQRQDIEPEETEVEITEEPEMEQSEEMPQARRGLMAPRGSAE